MSKEDNAKTENTENRSEEARSLSPGMHGKALVHIYDAITGDKQEYRINAANICLKSVLLLYANNKQGEIEERCENGKLPEGIEDLGLPDNFPDTPVEIWAADPEFNPLEKSFDGDLKDLYERIVSADMDSDAFGNLSLGMLERLLMETEVVQAVLTVRLADGKGRVVMKANMDALPEEESLNIVRGFHYAEKVLLESKKEAGESEDGGADEKENEDEVSDGS